MSNILEKLGLTDGVEREITIGKSFYQKDHSEYHTFRYDFKPASVDVKKMATVEIGEGNQVTVTVPHVDKGTGTTHTIFKGSKKPYRKECVLIIDNNTGEITLEKLTYNVQLKRTRGEGTSKISQSFLENNLSTSKKSPMQRRSPLQKSLLPSSSSSAAASSSRVSSRSESPNQQSHQPILPSRASPSVPCIATHMPGPSSISKHSNQLPAAIPSTSRANVYLDASDIGILSSSGSSSDSDDNGSNDSESVAEENKTNARFPPPLSSSSKSKITNGKLGKSKVVGSNASSVSGASGSSISSLKKGLAINKNGTNSRSSSPILPSRFPNKMAGYDFSKINDNVSSSSLSSSSQQVKSTGAYPKLNGKISPSLKINGKANFPKIVPPFSHPAPLLSMPKFSQLSDDLKLSESDSD